jgi:hypothetical protein
VVKGKISSSLWESNTRTPIVQPIAQHYTDSAILALTLQLSISENPHIAEEAPFYQASHGLELLIFQPSNEY